MDSGLSILPLPRPIGRDKTTVINQPVKLYIGEYSLNGATRITDAWGREIINVHYRSAGYGLRKWNIICVQSGKHLYTLRRTKNPGPGLMTIESPQKELIATFDSDGDHWGVLWSNTAGQGEKVGIAQRGSSTDRFPSLVWGQAPVVLFDRTGADGFKSHAAVLRDYQALVAPGTDLVWIATLIVAFELINFRNFF